MDSTLQRPIVWLGHEVLYTTMPECFANLQARTSTWSTYKHHITAKVLLGVGMHFRTMGGVCQQ